MTPERFAEIRRLANPSTNARWLSQLLNECLDALDVATLSVDWTVDVMMTAAPPPQVPLEVGDDGRTTTEYGPGMAERLRKVGAEHGVITSAKGGSETPEDRRIRESRGGEAITSGGTVAEKVGPEETAPAKRSSKEKK